MSEVSREFKSLGRFGPDEDRAVERVWEAGHEYAGHAVDTYILNSGSAISDFVRGKYSNDRLTYEEAEAGRRALEILDERYEELVNGDSDRLDYGRPRDERVGYFRKLRRVEREWKEHYLYPRTVEADVADYNEWVAVHARLAGLKREATVVRGAGPHKQYEYRQAISSLELAPTDGLRLIVPPNVEVTGDPGESQVYRWSNVDSERIDVEDIDIFPSTEARLASVGMKLF